MNQSHPTADPGSPSSPRRGLARWGSAGRVLLECLKAWLALPAAVVHLTARIDVLIRWTITLNQTETERLRAGEALIRELRASRLRCPLVEAPERPPGAEPWER